MNSVYFLVGLLDCMVGIMCFVTDQYPLGMLFLICAFLVSLGIDNTSRGDRK